jgi:predicted nucleotidyltransferase
VDFVRPVEAVIPGATGRVLGVLAATTSELNLATIARLAGVSPAQASRVLPGLVELGVVERREVPPSSLFRLVPEHVASRLLLGLSRARDVVLDEIGSLTRQLIPSATTVLVFGSLARGAAEADSDIDLLVIRPDDTGEDDDGWAASLEQLRDAIRRLAGNRVEVLEVDESAAAARLETESRLWADIARDGVVIHGRRIDQLRRARRG